MLFMAVVVIYNVYTQLGRVLYMEGRPSLNKMHMEREFHGPDKQPDAPTREPAVVRIYRKEHMSSGRDILAL